MTPEAQGYDMMADLKEKMRMRTPTGTDYATADRLAGPHEGACVGGALPCSCLLWKLTPLKRDDLAARLRLAVVLQACSDGVATRRLLLLLLSPSPSL